LIGFPSTQSPQIHQINTLVSFVTISQSFVAKESFITISQSFVAKEAWSYAKIVLKKERERKRKV
jgi:hypothetical protein